MSMDPSAPAVDPAASAAKIFIKIFLLISIIIFNRFYHCTQKPSFPQDLFRYLWKFYDFILLFLPLYLSHPKDFILFIRRKHSAVKRVSYFFHHRIIKIEIVNHAETHSKHLLCL